MTTLGDITERARPSSAWWRASGRPGCWRPSRRRCGASRRSSPARPRPARVRAGHRGGRAPARRAERERRCATRATAARPWSAAGRPRAEGIPLGATVALEGDRSSPGSSAAAAGAHRRLREARGALAERLRALGYRSSVAAPRQSAAGCGARSRPRPRARRPARGLGAAAAGTSPSSSRWRWPTPTPATSSRLARAHRRGRRRRAPAPGAQPARRRPAAARRRSRSSCAWSRRALEDDPDARAGARRGREQLGHALEELRELARGIHPAVLTDRGLGPALARSPTARRSRWSRATPDARLPEPVEAAAYYLVAEA